MDKIKDFSNPVPHIVQACLDIVRRFEGIIDGDPKTANLDAYLCPAGYWTIGWGHVVRDSRGRMIKGAENRALARSRHPNGITRAEALVLLRSDLTAFANFVRRVFPDTTLNEAAALTSFAFNLGDGNLGKSNLARIIREGNRDPIAITSNFLNWVSANGRVLNGLIVRRVAEAMLFYEGVYPAKDIYVIGKQVVQRTRNLNLDVLTARNPIL